MGANMFADNWQAADTSKYTGRRIRQLIGGTLTKSGARLLGARTGIHPAVGAATGVVTATTSTWTVNSHGGWLDLEASAISGPYPYSFDTAATGSVTAPNASNQRVDSIFVQVNDPTESDGTSTPDVVPVYVAGTAGAAGGARGAAGGPPNFPNTRCMELAQITVPQSGGGSPSVSIVAPYQVAAGGILPCRNSAEYPATPYKGQYVYDAALDVLLRWDGTAWTGPGVWTSYTPSFLNWIVGSGIIDCRWTKIGKLVTVQLFVQSGAGVSLNSSQVTIGLPIPASASIHGGASALTLYTGSAVYTAFADLNTAVSTSSVGILTTLGTTDTRIVPMTASTPFPASGGNLKGTIVYEAA